MCGSGSGFWRIKKRMTGYDDVIYKGCSCYMGLDNASYENCIVLSWIKPAFMWSCIYV